MVVSTVAGCSIKDRGASQQVPRSSPGLPALEIRKRNLDRPFAPCSSCCRWPFTSISCCLQFPPVSIFTSFGIFECQPPQLGHHPPAHPACCLLPLASTTSIVPIRTGHAQPCHPQSLPPSHADMISLCFDQTSSGTCPCPGAASALPGPAQAALAQNGFFL